MKKLIIKIIKIIKNNRYINEKKYKIVNWSNKESGKKAALIYITHPFKQLKQNHWHSNAIEARIIAEVIKEKGYALDIFDYRYTGTVKNNYELVIGFGDLMHRMMREDQKKSKYIYYVTEEFTEKRFSGEKEDVKKILIDYQISIPLRRQQQLMDKEYICKADLIMVPKAERIRKEIKVLAKSGVEMEFTRTRQKINKTNRTTEKNVLWIAGPGLIHKGLLNLLEIAEKNQDRVFKLAGKVASEEYELIEKKNKGNIKILGFVDINSEEFDKEISDCRYLLANSHSEGRSVAYLNMLACGLQPVVSVGAGIEDLGRNFGLIYNLGDEVRFNILDKLLAKDLSDMYCLIEKETSEQNYRESIVTALETL